MSSNPRREELKALSAPLSALKKEGAIDSINEALVEIYKAQGHHNLKTFHQWKDAGRNIKKGERALLLWGSPKPFKKKGQPEAPPPAPVGAQPQEQDPSDFFPICYVFSESQTIARDEK